MDCLLRPAIALAAFLFEHRDAVDRLFFSFGPPLVSAVIGIGIAVGATLLAAHLARRQARREALDQRERDKRAGARRLLQAQMAMHAECAAADDPTTFGQALARWQQQAVAELGMGAEAPWLPWYTAFQQIVAVEIHNLQLLSGHVSGYRNFFKNLPPESLPLGMTENMRKRAKFIHEKGKDLMAELSLYAGSPTPGP